MLEVKNIDVFYDEIQVLWNLSLKVSKGELTTVIGPNGAGKTTLVKTISGLLIPKNGEILFLNEKINGLPPYKIVKKGIIQVPEGRKLFPYMTVIENLEMGAYTVMESKKKENLEFVFNLFPILKERKNQLAGTLSGGEQQMLALARALMSSPKILILDEPSLGLAPRLVLKIFETINYLKENGITILLIEQNVKNALSLADKAYVLENGKIVLEGTGKEILENNHVKTAYLGI
ncbi:MAG: ABC transporter ATP-binding protein [Nitrososphaerota archaeon]